MRAQVQNTLHLPLHTHCQTRRMLCKTPLASRAVRHTFGQNTAKNAVQNTSHLCQYCHTAKREECRARHIASSTGISCGTSRIRTKHSKKCRAKHVAPFANIRAETLATQLARLKIAGYQRRLIKCQHHTSAGFKSLAVASRVKTALHAFIAFCCTKPNRISCSWNCWSRWVRRHLRR